MFETEFPSHMFVIGGCHWSNMSSTLRLSAYSLRVFPFNQNTGVFGINTLYFIEMDVSV